MRRGSGVWCVKIDCGLFDCEGLVLPVYIIMYKQWGSAIPNM
jgi:hypothetical protein